MICIYCLHENKSSQEHVIPQSFGLFGSTTMTIHCVCEDCNNKFGRGIDTVLARDTLEGHLRYKLGKFSSEKRFPQRVKTILKEGQAKGARVVLDQTTGRTNLINQISLINKQTKEITWLTLKELKALGTQGLTAYFLEKSKVGIIMNEQDKQWFLEELVNLGIEIGEREYSSGLAFMGHPDVKDDELINVPIKLRGDIDADVIRAISKIIYNFCALRYGAEVVMQEPFDNIRNFINGFKSLRPRCKHINESDGLENSDIMTPDISIETIPHKDGLLGKVVFWNVFAYEVFLTDEIIPVKPEFFKGVPELPNLDGFEAENNTLL